MGGHARGLPMRQTTRHVRLHVAVMPLLRHWRDRRNTLRSFAYLDDRSLRDLGVDPTLYRRRTGVRRRFPFD